MTVSKLLQRNGNYKTINNENSIIIQNKDNINNKSLYKIITSYSNRLYINKQKEKSFTSKKHIIPTIIPTIQSNKNILILNKNIKKKDFIEKYIASSDKKNEKNNTDKILLINNYRLSFNLLSSENNLKDINEEYQYRLKKSSALNYFNLFKKNEKMKIKEIEDFTRKLSEEKSNRENSIKNFYINYNMKTNVMNRVSNNIFKKRSNHCKSSYMKNKIFINEPMVLKNLINKDKDSENTIEKNTCNDILSSNGNTVNNYFRKQSAAKDKKVIYRISEVSKNNSKVKKTLLGLNNNLNDDNNEKGKRKITSYLKEIQKERSVKDINRNFSNFQKEKRNFEKNSDIINLI